MTTNAEELHKLNDLLGSFRFAMVTTLSEDGTLTAHPLTVQEREFDGDLWFIIGTDASTIENARRDPRVGVSFSSNDAWLSIAGTGEIVNDNAKLRDLWNPAVEAWFPDGPESSKVTLLKVSADTAEYWDSPGGRIASAIAFVKTKLTGDRPEGDNHTVEL